MNGTRWCSHSEANGMSRTITISSWSAAKVTVRWRPGSSERPENSSAYMAATRAGVSTRPSRPGSSPIAFSTRAMSTGTSGLRERGPVAVHRGQVAVALVNVQPVADHERRGDPEADVPQIEGHSLLSFLHQQRAHLEALGAAGLQVAPQVVEGETAVDDVLDHQHVPAGQVGVEILHDPDHSG